MRQPFFMYSNAIAREPARRCRPPLAVPSVDNDVVQWARQARLETLRILAQVVKQASKRRLVRPGGNTAMAGSEFAYGRQVIFEQMPAPDRVGAVGVGRRGITYP